MKTLIAAIVAGLLGAGAAVGAIAGGLVPLPETTAKRAPAAPQHEGDAKDGEADHSDSSAEMARLRNEIKDMQLALDRATAPGAAGEDADKEIATLKADIAALKKASTVGPRTVDGTTTGEAPKPVDPGFEDAVRAVNAKLDAEKQEQRRLDRQATRVTELEASKQRISDTIPKFVESQAQRLNLDATQVTAVSNALVAHLQAKADITSERAGQRIDDVEIDEAAFDKRLEDLDATTLSTLTSTLPKDAAENMLRSANRMGGGLRNAGTQPAARGPGQGRGNRGAGNGN